VRRSSGRNGEFDLDAFDQDKVNKHLRRLMWPRVTAPQLASALMRRHRKGSLIMPRPLPSRPLPSVDRLYVLIVYSGHGQLS
jgi:hypothetical protein